MSDKARDDLIHVSKIGELMMMSADWPRPFYALDNFVMNGKYFCDSYGIAREGAFVNIGNLVKGLEHNPIMKSNAIYLLHRQK